MLATRTIEIDDRRVRYARIGAGEPLVLAHGYPDDLQIFERLAPRLAATHDVIAFDWPGMGESEEWPGGASPKHLADRLVRLLDAWGVEQAHLVGADMGAPPVALVAARAPERVRSLVVLNSLLDWDADTSVEIALLRRVGLNRLAIRGFPRIVFARAERTFLPRGVRLDRALREEMCARFVRPEVRRYVSRMCAAYAGALRTLPRDLAGVRAPALALWGERDRHFPPAHGASFAAWVTGACVDVVPAGEHWMAWHAADAVADRILGFVRSASRQAVCSP